jgi:hypothetical protein
VIMTVVSAVECFWGHSSYQSRTLIRPPAAARRRGGLQVGRRQ